VDVLMLDLDVGFIDSPMNIVRKLGTSKSDIFVQVRKLQNNQLKAFVTSHYQRILLRIAQKDIAFVMNRSLEGWRTWYTAPQANIGT
jgi:hypothetical protein